MTHTPNWPTRKDWEANQRSRAALSIEKGVDAWDFGRGSPTFDEAERAEVESLAPKAIAAIRRACGQVEKVLRREQPYAANLARGWQKRSETTWRQYLADIDALTGAALDAYHDLSGISNVRQSLHRPTGTGIYGDHPDLFDCPTRYGWTFEERWPQRFKLPNSPELDRIRQINDQAVARNAEGHREHGWKVLAELDSGKAWEAQLEWRAHHEEWLRNGPAITRVKA
jgi:hypothetical protein